MLYIYFQYAKHCKGNKVKKTVTNMALCIHLSCTMHLKLSGSHIKRLWNSLCIYTLNHLLREGRLGSCPRLVWSVLLRITNKYEPI